MYGYIYLIVNKINGKTYIGQHQVNSILKDDGYMGSGKLIKLEGRKRSAEARKRMSDSHKGKHWKLVDGKRVWF